MRSTGPGLSEIYGLALSNKRQSGQNLQYFKRPSRSFLDLDEALDSPAEEHPMGRLFGTRIGRRAAQIVGNETRTLEVLERLCLEVLANAIMLAGPAESYDRILIVPSRPNSQSDSGFPRQPALVMLLSPRVGRVENSRILTEELTPSAAVLEKALVETAQWEEATSESEVWREVRESGPTGLSEVFSITRPEIVQTRRPTMEPLCVPSLPLEILGGRKVSTAGIFCYDRDGELGVTACYHGTGPAGTPVIVSGTKSTVKRADAVQDIVFVPLAEHSLLSTLGGLSTIRRVGEPARSERVHFDGMANQGCKTRVQSADPGLLRPRPTVQLRVQTDPDTDQGDSGCALLDENNAVLGFAFERTAYDDYPQFTDWIWASNALRALNLVPYGGS